MLRVLRHQHIFAFSPDAKPILEVDPGTEILFETLDSWGGKLQRPEDILSVPHSPDQANPAAGPVYLRGAEPGDALVAEILEIIPLPPIISKIVPSGGILAGEVQSPYCRFLDVQDGWVYYPWGISFPMQPMVGTIGTAPANGSIGNLYPGDHGGNMDQNDVRPGARLYLPVNVPGALFALGDVHASMGDGEVSGAGLDCCAEVRVRLDLVKRAGLARPFIETEDAWVCCASHPSVLQALRQATHDMVALLSRALSISREDAFLMVSSFGDGRPGQSDGGKVDATARMRFPPPQGIRLPFGR